jgi:drug/metabolite transporter (DMT)-like permease
MPWAAAVLMQTIREPGPVDMGKLLLLGAVWGSSFLCIDIALLGFPPLTIAALRVLLGATTLGFLVLATRQPLPKSVPTWTLITAVGLLSSALPFFLISWGQQYIYGGQSAILMAAGPFVALLFSHFLTHDDRLTASKLLGMMLGFSGVVVLVGADVLSGSSNSVFGQLAVVAAACCYAFSAILTRKLAGISALTYSAMTLLAGSVCLVPLAAALDRPWLLTPPTEALLAMLFLGLVPTALAFLLRFQIVQQVGATFMSMVAYLVPLFAVLWGWLLLSQIPPPRAWLALGLICLGLYVSRASQRARRRRSSSKPT